MKAKSIHGKTTADIKVALNDCLINAFKPTLAFVFLTNLEEINPISELLNAEDIAIFGASTSQKFTEQGIEPDGIVVLLLDLNTDYFKIEIKDYKDASVYESACQVGKVAKNTFQNPAFIISGANLNRPGEDIIKGLLDKAGADVSIIGGMAGEFETFSGYVFTNHAKNKSGFLSLILDADKIDTKGIAVSGWKPVGTTKKITKSEGSWVHTIDDKPAMDVLIKFMGDEFITSETKDAIVPINNLFPLQVQRESGIPMMRPALLWNKENQSVMLGGPVTEGSLFRFSLPPDFDIIDTVVESSIKIKDKELPDADAMLIFSCVGRLVSLGPMLPFEIEGLAATWNKPTAGFFSLGEFGRLDDSRPEFHGTTVSWVALKEK